MRGSSSSSFSSSLMAAILRPNLAYRLRHNDVYDVKRDKSITDYQGRDKNKENE